MRMTLAGMLEGSCILLLEGIENTYQRGVQRRVCAMRSAACRDSKAGAPSRLAVVSICETHLPRGGAFFRQHLLGWHRDIKHCSRRQ